MQLVKGKRNPLINIFHNLQMSKRGSKCSSSAPPKESANMAFSIMPRIHLEDDGQQPLNTWGGKKNEWDGG